MINYAHAGLWRLGLLYYCSNYTSLLGEDLALMRRSITPKPLTTQAYCILIELTTQDYRPYLLAARLNLRLTAQSQFPDATSVKQTLERLVKRKYVSHNLHLNNSYHLEPASYAALESETERLSRLVDAGKSALVTAHKLSADRLRS